MRQKATQLLRRLPGAIRPEIHIHIKSKLYFTLGTGYATVVMSFLYGSYFTTIIVYCLFYFFNSFHAVLPWTYCHEDVENKTSLNWWASDNCTDATMNQTDNSVPVTQDYFDNFLLHKTSGIEEVNNFRLNSKKLQNFHF